jgi:hypothetical protein
MTAMKTVGRRATHATPLADQAALARTAATLRGATGLVPRGVFRFKTFEEADAWMIDAIHRTRERLSRTTSSASAVR